MTAERQPRRRVPKRGVERPGLTPKRYRDILKHMEEGTFTLDMLDDEEILRGRMRNSAGDFRGRPPALIPQVLYGEMIKRQRQMLMEEIGPLARSALKTAAQMVEHGTTVHDGPRAQMVKLALEYGLGRPVDKVETSVQVKVEHYGNVILESTVPVTLGKQGELEAEIVVEEEL